MKKKIIIFMPTVNTAGGVEKNFFIITNYLSKKLKEISVITLSKFVRPKLNKRIKVIYPNFSFFENLGRRTKFLISLIFLFKEIKQNKEATVLCFQGIMYCILLCKLTKTKIIIRSNSSPSGWSKNWLKQFLYKKIYGLANKIIVNSMDFKKELNHKFKLKSICIYNPLNTKEIYKYSKKNTKIKFFKRKSINIINIARFTEQKDHDCLIKSINLLKDEYNIRLIILGSGPLKNKITYLIKSLDLSKNIKIINPKKNPYPYIIKSDLFVLTSKYEGSPNVLLEAVALKKFIISSDCPTGPREILDRGMGGELFKVGNYQMLSKKIKFFIENKKKLEKKKNYAFKRLDRFDYFERLRDYYKAIND